MDSLSTNAPLPRAAVRRADGAECSGGGGSGGGRETGAETARR